MAERMYRSAWVAVQEDGGKVTLYGIETGDLAAAKADRDEVTALPYIEEAWVETSQWARVVFASRATSGRVET